MDILKVLSRGTKKTQKGSQNASNAQQKLPSAGTTTNPQLYHDQVRGQKRKRTKNEPEPEVQSELPEVDFFAPKPEPVVKEAVETEEAVQAPKPTRSSQTLSEDECRQLLRSHRLKITLLSKPEDQSKVKKSKKKKKAAVEVKKDSKKQLFPQPLDSFGELRQAYGLSDKVADNLVFQGYRVPTEVQMGSLPLLVHPQAALKDEDGLDGGVDFLAIAPTGSGKTISFLIPAINNILRRRSEEKTGDIHELEAIVVAPTRELVHQIVSEGQKLSKGTGLRVVSMKKQTQLSAEQVDMAEDSSEDEDKESDSEDDDEKPSDDKPKQITKADILVTTPFLLLKFLTSGPAGTQKVLPTVRDLILDEADVLLDPLFRDATMADWTACTNNNLRVSFWSATMGSNIESMVTEKLTSRAESLAITPKPFVRLVVGLKDTAVPNIAHKLIYTASEQGKLLALRQLLHPTGSGDSGPPLRPPFLVFTQTIDRATALHEELQYDIPLEAGGAARIAALHSGLTDSARSAIMRKFRAGDIWVLITTDVLARGVDFAGVNGVVNYDVPGSSAGYVHRAGRTGRAGREGGVAVTFYTKEDIPFVKMVANVIAASEKQAGKTGDEAGIQKWLLDALPNVGKADRKKLKERGVEARRSGTKAKITSKSGYERRKENNRRGAIEGSKKRKLQANDDSGDDGEWGGFDD
ncbi:P-loop containing nucleoside triphosphate hydrolase protein [Fusarium flagelliforme]|uniref:ATP-dependent RNA helicase n=1 Tax=Fusarium flagelliforme TaxID=2675880 RepID=A0A395MT69_9HYPO|nr:P-loop containing nucleoside triphosphate hydrolase protein [Fusarium flagelliforme]KAH7197203.1 P-loop containing nucleoside triphosphate hydrolase protein [Fusarium flagelliforme]RFN51148.1 ATP-dependent rna helicase rok1 [Fusarium flagelliforme]